MWIVRLALRRPYTIAVACILAAILGVLSASRMIVDIFPAIDIPVVAVVWSYPGLSAEEMERKVVIISERAFSTSVNGIERIESQSTPGIGMLKVYFQPGTDIGAAIAQLSATSGTILRITPPGMTAPTILQFNASNVPVAQITLQSRTLPEQKIFDYALNFIRIRLFTIPGLGTPAPYGGKSRQVTMDLDPKALAAKGLSPFDVLSALSSQNLVLPAGTARMGNREYAVETNSTPDSIAAFQRMPIKVVGGRPVLLGDVASVYDGFADQTNIVRVNGSRATYLAILKHADASTLAVVDAAKEMIPDIQAAAPRGLDVKLDFDQSTFVRAAIKGVVLEAAIASLLVSLMILVFLGSWRGMVIVCTSIPIAILVGIIGLKLTGDSINIMTLGGLALAVGMLVDDATVAIENIHRNQAMGKPVTPAILDGSDQIAVPAIVATLSICIVFFPVVLLTGPAKFLFTPLALAVVLAMLASYVLSRTLVPALCRMLLPGEHHGPPPADGKHHPLDKLLHRFNPARDRIMDRFNARYERALAWSLRHRRFVLGLAGSLLAASLALVFAVGTDFFPAVDVGLMKLHYRGPSGTRIEETESQIARLEARLRQVIPPEELDTINADIGVPSSYNLAFVPTDNTGPMDADILIQLKKDHHPTDAYMDRIRKEIPRDFPGSSLYFQPADIVSQVLNFGVSAPIDVQVEGMDLAKDYEWAERIRRELATIPGVVDTRVKQVPDYPELKLDVDREKAARLGLTQRDVANATLITLTGNGGVSPTRYLDPSNGVDYNVSVKVPTAAVDSVDALMRTPITPPAAAAISQAADARDPLALPEAPAQTLGNLAMVRPLSTANEVDHHTVQRVMDVMAGVQGRDLGGVVSDIQARLETLGALPKGMRVTLRGQNEVMRDSFRSMGLGLILAIILDYLLMVVLFQSWLDPLIIMMAVPGAMAGVLWTLALTGTTLNVESLMGAIMAVGIATSNSILLVSFANDWRAETGAEALPAAQEAGRVRLRPVLMTALAMILGMVPMALGLGEGGEQNAPLGRAVIGGLLMATVATLFVVPVIYSLLRRKPPVKHELDERFEKEARGEMP
jgi:multidrug efflux pump subunit AcrB